MKNKNKQTNKDETKRNAASTTSFGFRWPRELEPGGLIQNLELNFQ